MPPIVCTLICNSWAAWKEARGIAGLASRLSRLLMEGNAVLGTFIAASTSAPHGNERRQAFSLPWAFELRSAPWISMAPSSEFSLQHLDEAAAPEDAYLPNPALAPLADAALVVQGGARLPVHSHVLSVASPVLLQAFAADAEAGGGGGGNRVSGRSSMAQPSMRSPRGCVPHLTKSSLLPNPGANVQEPVLLSTPFCGYPRREVALWLCFAYRPQWLTARNLGTCGALLPAAPPAQQLVQLAAAADACELAGVRQQALARLAGLFRCPGALRRADTNEIAKQLGEGALACLLAELARLSTHTTGEFTWSIPDFKVGPPACLHSASACQRAPALLSPCVGAPAPAPHTTSPPHLLTGALRLPCPLAALRGGAH